MAKGDREGARGEEEGEKVRGRVTDTTALGVGLEVATAAAVPTGVEAGAVDTTPEGDTESVRNKGVKLLAGERVGR